jgi:outer membrane protein
MNKRVFIWAAGALLACGAMVCAQTGAQPPAQQPAAPAQTMPAPSATAPAATGNLAAGAVSTATGANKVATVHIQQAIAECAEGKKATDDLQKRFAPKKEELERKQKEITDLQQKLQQGEKVLSDDQRSQLMREIDRKTKDFNRDNDDATADYQQAVDGMFNGIGNKMLQVIAVYAQKNGFDLVLNSAQPGTVLWQKQTVDITDEIKGAYNMTFPASGLTAPPAAPGARPPATKPATPPATPPATKKPQ